MLDQPRWGQGHALVNFIACNGGVDQEDQNLSEYHIKISDGAVSVIVSHQYVDLGSVTN